MTKHPATRPFPTVTRETADLGGRARTGDASARKRRLLGGLLPWVLLGTVSVLAVSVAQIGRGDGEIEDVTRYAYKGGNHTETRVTYPETPGAGGAHHPVWQNCGVYTRELYDEHVVHSLEHGAVSITYDPETVGTDTVDALTKRWGAHPYVIVSPRSGLAGPIVLTAWNRQLTVDEPTDPRIGIFVARYAEGPQAPESGAPCTRGTTRTTTSPWDGPITGNSMPD